jgi:hypothetical protein
MDRVIVNIYDYEEKINIYCQRIKLTLEDCFQIAHKKIDTSRSTGNCHLLPNFS